MNVSTRLLREMVPGLDGTPEELAEHLALRGAPVDEISSPGAELGDIVIGKVISAGQHPNADRLSLCEVDGGEGVVQVVCGAPNVKAGTYYPFAPVGAVLPGEFKIKKAKIRGEVSQGMLCSARELGLGQDHDGILELDGEFTPGESFVAAIGLDDATLDVEITANRGDLLSHVGVARELASDEGGEVRLADIPGGPEWSSEPGDRIEYIQGQPRVESRGVSIEIAEGELCRRFLGIIIRGVKVGPSPAWLQERLRGMGARPINNVVDATNYVMLELGQPMHAYDLDRLGGQSIIVRLAGKGEETFTTLDDEERAITPSMLMVCDADRPIGVGGVMGGLHSEVEDDTTNVFLEAALWEPKQIRATRRALIMSTDASYRFERGVDPEGMKTAIERCLAVILATAGGEVDGPGLDCCPTPFESEVVPLRLSRIERLLGIPFEADYVTSLLAPLGFVVESSDSTDGGVLQVRVPGFRSYDVTREVDLIEEVARTHGFDRFPDHLGPERPGTVPDHPLFQLEDELRAGLAGRGLYEAHTPSFAPPGEGDVEVANPLATTEPYMRWAITPALIRRVEYNLAHGNRNVRLFEIGTAFRAGAKGEAPLEATHLAAVATGLSRPSHWSRADEALSIWDLKALAESVVGQVFRGVGAVVPHAATELPDAPHGDVARLPAHLDAATSFELRDGDANVVGFAGRVREDAVDAPVWAGDLWALELKLPESPAPRIAPTHAALPDFPASERDLALLVPDGVSAGEVGGHIARFGGKELEAVELFDVYTGDEVGEGGRSIAFRLRFRSATRTLRDKDVDKSMRTLLKRLEEDLGVSPRG